MHIKEESYSGYKRKCSTCKKKSAYATTSITKKYLNIFFFLVMSPFLFLFAYFSFSFSLSLLGHPVSMEAASFCFQESPKWTKLYVGIKLAEPNLISYKNKISQGGAYLDFWIRRRRSSKNYIKNVQFKKDRERDKGDKQILNWILFVREQERKKE